MKNLVKFVVVLVAVCAYPSIGFSGNPNCFDYGHYKITHYPAFLAVDVVSYVGTKGPWECNGACGNGCTNAGDWKFDSGNDTRYTQMCLEHDQFCSYQPDYLFDPLQKLWIGTQCAVTALLEAPQYDDDTNNCTLPVIRQISPAFGFPGDIVKITGENFQANGNTVDFGVSTFFDHAEILSQSENLIIAIVPQPSNNIRTVDIGIDTHDRGRAEKMQAFTYLNVERTNFFEIAVKNHDQILSSDAVHSWAVWPQNRDHRTQWYMIPTHDGYMRFVSSYTGLCLSSREGRRETKMWLCGDEQDGGKQQWKLESVDNEYYKVINREFDTCLDSAFSRSNSPALEWPCEEGATEQMWKFVEFPVNAPARLEMVVKNHDQILSYDKEKKWSWAIWPRNRDFRSQWSMTPTNDGYMRLVNTASGLCLSSSVGTRETKMQTCGDQADGGKQEWKLEPVDNEYYKVINREFNTCLDSAYSRSNSPALEWPCEEGATEQMWKFVGFPVNASAYTGSGNTYGAFATIPSQTTMPLKIMIAQLQETQTPVSNTGTIRIGSAYEFMAMNENGEDVTQFTQPVNVVLPYEGNVGSESMLKIRFYDEALKTWRELPSIIDTLNHRVMAQTTHFTKFAVFAPNVTDPNPLPTGIPNEPPVNPSAVPEPTTLILFGVGLFLTLWRFVIRRQRK